MSWTINYPLESTMFHVHSRIRDTRHRRRNGQRDRKEYLGVLDRSEVQAALKGKEVHVVGQILLLIGDLIVGSLARC